MFSNSSYYGEIEDKRVVLLQSGGLDSNVCAAILSHHNFEIHHLFVNYGQNTANQELKRAREIVKYYGGELSVADLTLPWLDDVALVKGNVSDANSEGTLNTIESGVYVPLRNAILLNLAGSLAEKLKISYICSALDGIEDVDGFPLGGTTDKHPSFVRSVEESINRGSVMCNVDCTPFTILTPVMGMCKTEIIRLGLMYDADMSLSWSCYNSEDKPCGRCSACITRAEAFKELGIDDPSLQK